MTKALFLSVLFLMTAACGTYQATTQLEEGTYLQLIGDTNKEQLIIDNGEPIVLGEHTKSYDLNGRTATKIKVQPGTHTIKLMRQGQVVIHRKIFITDGNSFEVKI